MTPFLPGYEPGTWVEIISPHEMLRSLHTAANPEFASGKDRFGSSGFSRNEFHVLSGLPSPSTLTFDDLLQGATP